MPKSWKFGAVILCNVTKKVVEKNQNCSYRDDDVTNHVIFFEKLCKKWLKYVFFFKQNKINLVTVRKKIFKMFLQLLKVKIM